MSAMNSLFRNPRTPAASALGGAWPFVNDCVGGWSKAFLLVLVLFASSNTAVGQDIQFGYQKGPHYVGEPVVVQVLVDLDAGDVVTCQLAGDVPDGLTVDGPHVSRSSRSMTQIINGRVTNQSSVIHEFLFAVTADREGEFSIGPFDVVVNGTSQTLEGTALRFGQLAPDPAMTIEYFMPTDSVYVGQRIPLTIRWSYRGEFDLIKYAFGSLQIRSPLFDRFAFESERLRSRTVLLLATVKGGVEVAAEIEQTKVNGEDAIVITGTRTLIAEQPGEYVELPITCRTKRVTRWGRSRFGERTIREEERSFAVGKPLTFTIKPIPIANRPASFSGAVGSGFSIDVAANRSVVRVGDPISLTVTLRGQGNFDSISLPLLESNLGLPAGSFQVPSEPVPGVVGNGSKQFKVNIRVKNQQVVQISEIAFSWFDPVQEKFLTAHSKPIALQVMDTQIVSSQDVVSAQKAAPNDPTPPGQGDVLSHDVVSDWDGANLAIETDPIRLLATGSRVGLEAYAPASVYGLAVVFGFLFLVRGERSKAKVAVSRNRAALAGMKKSLSDASSLEPKEALTLIAETLRSFVKEFEPVDRAGVEKVISECDDWIYSPSEVGSSAEVRSLIEQGLVAIDSSANKAS